MLFSCCSYITITILLLCNEQLNKTVLVKSDNSLSIDNVDELCDNAFEA